MTKLTPKQERFCLEYLIDSNATQAAIRAGYSPNAAQEQASRLLSNVMVESKIQELRSLVADRLKIDAEWVLTRFKAIAGFQLKDVATFDGSKFEFKPMNEWSEGSHRAIRSSANNQNYRRHRDSNDRYQVRE